MAEEQKRQWDKWGYKAELLAEYRELMIATEGSISKAIRSDSASSAYVSLSNALTTIRKATRTLESLRFQVDPQKDDRDY